MPVADDDVTGSGKGSQSFDRKKQPGQSWFATPRYIKALFDKFPLHSFPANELPLRRAQHRERHTLWIFATEEDALSGGPSFNPTCLKWQTYLKFRGLDFVTIPSNNHASPSGALPFLLPPTSTKLSSPNIHVPVASNKLRKWLQEQRIGTEEPENMRYAAYAALLDSTIREAWLYHLYLDHRNFNAVAAPLYVNPTTQSYLVRKAASHQLRAAAQAELLKSAKLIDRKTIYALAEEALESLSILLGDDQYFFGSDAPGLLDASVFAYTHLLLEDDLGGNGGWQESRLNWVVKNYSNLVRHRRRVYKGWFM